MSFLPEFLCVQKNKYFPLFVNFGNTKTIMTSLKYAPTNSKIVKLLPSCQVWLSLLLYSTSASTSTNKFGEGMFISQILNTRESWSRLLKRPANGLDKKRCWWFCAWNILHIFPKIHPLWRSHPSLKYSSTCSIFFCR